MIGQAGASYSVDLENPTRDRVEVVVSVDGMDVLTGSSASVKGRGYTIAPRSSIRCSA